MGHQFFSGSRNLNLRYSLDPIMSANALDNIEQGRRLRDFLIRF